jgi:hypothetical protein
MPERTTILGTAFRCTECDKIYIAGALGMEALEKRVTQHMHETGHMDIPPINPPIGMRYVRISDGTPVGVPDGTPVGVPFDGEDKDKWFDTLRSKARQVFGIRPAWGLDV